MNKHPGAAWLLRPDAPPCRLSPRDLEALLEEDEEEGWGPKFDELYKLMNVSMVELVYFRGTFPGVLYADEMGHFVAEPQLNACATAMNMLEHGGLSAEEAAIVGTCVFIPDASCDRDKYRHFVSQVWVGMALKVAEESA